MDIIHLIKFIRPHRLQKFVARKYFKYCETTWRQRPLPDFIIIGAQKSGTSSLHGYLCQHPQLFSSPFKREIHFFDSSVHKRETDNYEKGESWYRAHFPSQRELDVDSRIFEATPLYLFHPLVPERIFNLVPEIKLIALLRNPTERAISHYYMNMRKNVEPLPMLEAFQQEEARLKNVINEQDYRNELFFRISYKSRGRYAEQLERYLKYFPLKQILLLGSDEFFNDPQASLRRVFDFVGVDPGFKINDLTPRNVGKNKSDVPPAVREYLNEYFLYPNQALYELTGINFSV